MWWYFVLGIVVFLLVVILWYIQKLRKNGDWIAARDGDFQEAFFSVLEGHDTTKAALVDTNPALADALAEIVAAFAERYREGVVLACVGSPKFQMLDFYGPSRVKGHPMIEVQWSHTTSRKEALQFLNEENVETIDCRPDIFLAIFEHLAAFCRTSGKVDVLSGCKVYEGYLSPVVK